MDDAGAGVGEYEVGSVHEIDKIHRWVAFGLCRMCRSELPGENMLPRS